MKKKILLPGEQERDDGPEELEGSPDLCPKCGSKNTEPNGALIINPAIQLYRCKDCDAGWRETEESYQNKVRAQAEERVRQVREYEEQALKDKHNGLLPFGTGLRFFLKDLVPIPIGNRNKVVTINGRGSIKKDKKAEAYIKEIRTALYCVYKDLCNTDALIKATTFPIDGKKTPVRADVYFCYAKKDRTHGQLKRADLDNLAKGVLDGLKVGPTNFPGIEWGLISDDNYITELVLVKGDAPEDGEGSRIIINVSRAGWRSEAEMSGLIGALQPWPPWLPAAPRLVSPRGFNPIKPNLPGIRH